MAKKRRPLTPAYIFFYLLFLPDTWRILIGIIASVLLTPFVLKPEMEGSSQIVLFIMMAAIGYAVSGVPARWITGYWKKFFLGDKRH